MAYDFYKKKSDVDVKVNESNIYSSEFTDVSKSLSSMNLDSDLQRKLNEAAKELEREKIMEHLSQESVIKEDRNYSMDIKPHPDMASEIYFNSSSNNSQNGKEAQKSCEQCISQLQELLAQLEIDNSEESIEEHRMHR